MSREIKFRAWDNEGEQMIIACPQNYWLLISTDGEVNVYNLGKLLRSRDDYEIMQFTGLYDKNGREIYEGDILLVPDEETIHILDDGSGPTEPFNHIVEVVFQEGSFGIMITDGGNGYNKGFQSPQYIEFYIGDKFSEFEIIGNKYQNPELLK